MDRSLSPRLLPALLAVVAGSTDAIGFLGLGGLFTAHITGNLVVLAASAVTHGDAPLAVVLSVPVFMIVVVLTRLLAATLESFDLPTLQPLLVLQSLLLVGFLALRVAVGPHIEPKAVNAVLAGMLGVAAMAVQNALVLISLKGISSTAVMTTNVTRFALDVADVAIASDPRRRQEARTAAGHTWPQIVGFLLGCGIGAASEAAFGSWSAASPVTLAIVAAAIAFDRTPSASIPDKQPSTGRVASSS
jgi:uncharacterized membrane protein YoaK (UPF0700 family)